MAEIEHPHQRSAWAMKTEVPAIRLVDVGRGDAAGPRLRIRPGAPVKTGERFGCCRRETRSVNAPVEQHTRKMCEMAANRAALPDPPAYAPLKTYQMDHC